ncbi:MAG TPA: zinc ribbon domain-containing protein [Pyrinomonadaceae bacterium]|nr:zinc ribbon domain-containing protein [Pyrinomonadaceae bacterium]
MYCPKCGQSQVSADVRFCSRCGFPLVVVGNLLLTGGTLPARATESEAMGARPVSPRRRGVKHGVAVLLVSILLIPFFGIMHEAIGMPIEFMTFGALGILAGFIRIIYAVFFEDAAPRPPKVAAPPPELYTPPIHSRLHAPTQGALPQSQGIPVNDYRQPQVQTAELMHPPSVTDHTTRLLDKQPDSAEQ